MTKEMAGNGYFTERFQCVLFFILIVLVTLAPKKAVCHSLCQDAFRFPSAGLPSSGL